MENSAGTSELFFKTISLLMDLVTNTFPKSMAVKLVLM